MRTRAIAIALALALSHAPAAAIAKSALDTLEPVATISIAFKNSALDPDTATTNALEKALAKAVKPACYWTVTGKNANEAKAARAALGEAGVAPERVIVKAVTAPATASAWCKAPTSVRIAFETGKSSLSDAARDELDLAALVMSDRGDGDYVIDGFAKTGESNDPVRLAMERAIVARAWLVARGIAASRLTFKSAQGDDSAVAIVFK